MSRIEYSPLALDDLISINDYIIENWGNNVADRKLMKIISDIKRLDEYPMLGVSLGKIIESTTEYRYIFTEKNYIFYHIELDKIRIIRVLNEKQDFIQQLFVDSKTEKNNINTD